MMTDPIATSTAPTVFAADTEGVLGRRVVAWLLDALIVGVLLVALHFALAIFGLLTLGLGWLLFGVLPLVPFLYSFGSLASRYAATPGQRMMHLTVVHHESGRRPTTLEAFVSTALFYLSVTFAPIFLVALVTDRHRTLHDILSGLLVVHSKTLTVQTGAWNMPHGTTA